MFNVILFALWFVGGLVQYWRIQYDETNKEIPWGLHIVVSVVWPFLIMASIIWWANDYLDNMIENDDKNSVS